MSRKSKVLIAAGVLALLAAAKFLPVTIEFFQRRSGPFEESVLQAFGVDVQDIYSVQVLFRGEGEFTAKSPEDYVPVLDYLLSLNVSSVFPQSSVASVVSDQIIFLDFPGGSLSVYLLDDNHFAVWGKDAAGYTVHHAYRSDSTIDADLFREQFNSCL